MCSSWRSLLNFASVTSDISGEVVLRSAVRILHLQKKRSKRVLLLAGPPSIAAVCTSLIFRFKQGLKKNVMALVLTQRTVVCVEYSGFTFAFPIICHLNSAQTYPVSKKFFLISDCLSKRNKSYLHFVVSQLTLFIVLVCRSLWEVDDCPLLVWRGSCTWKSQHRMRQLQHLCAG